MSQLTWQKSSFSEPGGDTCVEVALDRIGLRLRESVTPGTVATLAPSALVALVDWAKGRATSVG
ncbi:DUF397 domain-containing protein [Streptomyces acidicola]|uniref:DUF397 domain-containing protein n=1 Tax=Streptomyces acidicola TaxID=2596892 RepID=A0A5N8X3H1_9ACTN|nr:DUF397 domain-containing protein [Streptomyces acidicola]MPY53428.1 DUF397 domain-containing protein [Streptomyces acidicola]